MARGKGSLANVPLEPGLCLLCGVPAVFYDVQGNVIKCELGSPVYTCHTLFESLCRCLDIPNGCQIRRKWDFDNEPFPFCESCKELMGSLVDLYRQVEQMVKTVKVKGLQGIPKFIPLSEFDERTQLFRNFVNPFDKRRQIGTVQNNQGTDTRDNNQFNLTKNVSIVKPGTLSSFQKTCNNTRGSKETVNLEHDVDNTCGVSSDADDIIIEACPPRNEVDLCDKKRQSRIVHQVNRNRDDYQNLDMQPVVVLETPSSFSKPCTRGSKQPTKVEPNDNDNPRVIASETEEVIIEPEISPPASPCDDYGEDQSFVDPDCTGASDVGNYELKPSSDKHNDLSNDSDEDCSEGSDGEDWSPSTKRRKSAPKQGNSKSAEGVKKPRRSRIYNNTKSCLSCPRKFPDKKMLHQHMRSQHGMEKLKCDLCPSEYISIVGLKYHQKVAHAIGDLTTFDCSICSRAFSDKSGLNEHMSVHSDKYNFSCEKCGLKTKTQNSLKSHLRTTHAETKNHICSICSKAFCVKARLVRHMSVHTEDRNYMCDMCPKAYKDKSRLVKHKKKNH